MLVNFPWNFTTQTKRELKGWKEKNILDIFMAFLSTKFIESKALCSMLIVDKHKNKNRNRRVEQINVFIYLNVPAVVYNDY